MPLAQLQRVRRYANGGELVVFAENRELANHREYEDAISALDHQCLADEFTRTVGEGSPLWVFLYTPSDEDDEQ